MFSANTNFQIRSGGTSSLGTHSDQLAYPFLVKYLEWIMLQDPGIYVYGQKFTRIIPGITESHLGQVIGPE